MNPKWDTEQAFLDDLKECTLDDIREAFRLQEPMIPLTVYCLEDMVYLDPEVNVHLIINGGI